jgi:ribonuclease P/MRP protein subunit RPP40
VLSTSNDVKLKLYADDLKLYATVDSQLEYEALQDKLKLLENWSDMWQLKFSVSKCKHLRVGHSSLASHRYSLLGNDLERVSECVDLGITVDDRLRFHSHIRTIATRAHQRANMILRCFLTHDVNCLIKAFTVYVRPIVEYCSSVWSPTYKKDIDLLEKVQRRFTKRLPGFKHLSYLERLANLNLKTLEARRLLIDLCLCYKIVKGLVNINLSDMFAFAAHCSSTRGHPLKLVKPHARVNGRMFFFSLRIVDVWNSLPADVVTSNTYNQFKRGLLNVNLDKFLTVM